MSTEDIREKQDRDIGPIAKQVLAHVERLAKTDG